MFQSVLVTDEAERQASFLPSTPQNKVEVIEIEVGIITGSAAAHCDMLRMLHKGKKEKAIAYVERYAHLSNCIENSQEEFDTRPETFLNKLKYKLIDGIIRHK